MAVAGVLAFFALWTAPAPAVAAELVPCTATPPPVGPVVEIDGDATIVVRAPVRRALNRAGVRTRLLAPANNFTGRPTYPVGTVSYGDPVSRIGLGGGFRLGKGKRQLQFRGLTAVVRNGGDTFVNARFGGGLRRLFIVKGGNLTRNQESGEMNLVGGNATLSGAAAVLIKKRFGMKRVRVIAKARSWGRLDLYSLYRVTLPPTDPEAETPVEPPVLTRPAGAANVSSASIDWRIRDSFIRYISSGDGANAIDGAIPGPPEGAAGDPQLVYNFNFPFAGGWSDATTDSTLVKGTGGVAFRYCRNTINFMVHDPEVELNGDLSRLIFRVKGTDGTAFPDSRAVMVGLRLSQAESVQTVGNTTTYTKVPGFVPEESAGLFADFYMPGADFGYLTISYTT